jgi:hypothetical protein
MVLGYMVVNALAMINETVKDTRANIERLGFSLISSITAISGSTPHCISSYSENHLSVFETLIVHLQKPLA